MKTITTAELAKIAGVSQSTVSRCLNDSPLVSVETKALVKKIAEENNFQFNMNARGLKTNKTGVVGYIFSQDFTGFSNHYIQSDLYYRIRMKLLPHGLDVVPVFDDCEEGGQNPIEKSIMNRRFDALIFNRQNVSQRIEALLEETNIPYIFIYDTNESMQAPFMIAPRHTGIGYTVGKAFCDAGYTKFVEVTGPSNRIDVVHKHAGFIKALGESDMELSASNVLCADYKLEQAEAVTRQHIALFQPGTAVFAQNDMIALGVLEALKQKGIRVPEDVVIIGVDNVVMGRWFYPQLTTIAIDYDKIISLTEQWILNATAKRDQTEYRYFLDGEMIVRKTFIPLQK